MTKNSRFGVPQGEPGDEMRKVDQRNSAVQFNKGNRAEKPTLISKTQGDTTRESSDFAGAAGIVLSAGRIVLGNLAKAIKVVVKGLLARPLPPRYPELKKNREDNRAKINY